MKFLSPLLTISSLFPLILTLPLKSVIILYRHGDRTPGAKCPALSHTWEQGFGSLLNDGKERAFQLGEYFRAKYGSILSPYYNESEIYVRSSDISRSLMTAYCVQAGLYKPQGRDQWSTSLLWQPIPVHSIPKNIDNLLYFFGVNCPKYFQLLKDQTYYYKKQIDGYVGTLKEMAKISPDIKVSAESFEALAIGHHLHDCFFIEQKNGRELPKWVEKYYPKKLTEISKFFFSFFDSDVSLKRLHCGPLLQDIMGNFEKIIKGEKGFESMKMYQYSAHDTTVVALLQCLNVFDGEIVPYLSTVMLELYEGKSINTYQIAIKYRKEKDNGVYEEKELFVPGCNPKSEYCDFETFKKLVRGNLPDNWEEECNDDTSSYDIHIPG